MVSGLYPRPAVAPGVLRLLDLLLGNKDEGRRCSYAETRRRGNPEEGEKLERGWGMGSTFELSAVQEHSGVAPARHSCPFPQVPRALEVRQRIIGDYVASFYEVYLHFLQNGD